MGEGVALSWEVPETAGKAGVPELQGWREESPLILPNFYDSSVSFLN